ncbi:hypothetical protein BSKO_10837 [Bryopsis sp. KO-2023]|nr:hypothetical protein BSKO_10837 [Bryopsis sp. KO-2023]
MVCSRAQLFVCVVALAVVASSGACPCKRARVFYENLTNESANFGSVKFCKNCDECGAEEGPHVETINSIVKPGEKIDLCVFHCVAAKLRINVSSGVNGKWSFSVFTGPARSGETFSPPNKTTWEIKDDCTYIVRLV